MAQRTSDAPAGGAHDGPSGGLPTRPVGCSLIAGRVAEPAEDTFAVIRASTGDPLPPPIFPATPRQVDAAATAAWSAFNTAWGLPHTAHAELLETAAAKVGSIAEALVTLAAAETGLPQPRLNAELERTTATMRMFAEVVREGSWVGATIDRAGAGGRPTAAHDLRRMLRAVGPVAVFGASNFPLAYGTAGTDTASALAAGCPVIVKGHPLHAGTGELVAYALNSAVSACGMPAGWFSFLHAGGEREHDIGRQLVKHPCVRAVGFTGGKAGGDELARLAARRPDPIPFFAEMGSVNPAIVLPGAAAAEPEKIGRTLAAAITASTGQQCTRPGVVFVIEGEGIDAMVRSMAAEMAKAEAQPMLSPRVHANYMRALRAVLAVPGVDAAFGEDRVPPPLPPGKAAHAGPVSAAPLLLQYHGDAFAGHPELVEEVFGPCALLVRCPDASRLVNNLGVIVGSLTGSMFVGGSDRDLAAQLLPILEQRCGRVVFNGVPTGVEVAWSMVHGGPYPASSRPDTSAVGPTAMARWRRPVCYQNAPANVLPPELLDENPLGIERLVDGVRTRDAF